MSADQDLSNEHFGRWQAAGWLLFGLISVLNGLPLHVGRRYAAYFAPYCVLGFAAGWPLRRLCDRAMAGGRRWSRSAPALVVACYGLGWLIAVGAFAAQSLLLGAAAPYPLGWRLLQAGLGDALGACVLLGAWCAVYVGAVQWRAMHVRERRLLEVEALAREAELRALRREITPHFLFNTLNGIATLVGEGDISGARRAIALLGDFLRSMLALGRREEAALAEELELARQYLEIEQVRLGGKVRFQVECGAECAGILVPVLILQPLVENAVRHGAALSPHGDIAVCARREGDRLTIEVQNARSRVKRGAAGSGMGLDATRERVRAHYGDAGMVEVDTRDPDRWRVVLTLPGRSQEAAACVS